MLHKTKAVILRSVKYGETSLIVSAYTELYGLQSYIVQGVRVNSKKVAARANYFQPGAILELIVYHHDLKNLQRIKEFRWSYLYQELFADVIKNSVMLYMMELLQKCVKQPENNPDLFYFVEEALMELDKASAAVTANFPLYFSLHLTNFFGFQMNTEDAERFTIFDLQEGSFVAEQPRHPHFLEDKQAEITSQMLKVMRPNELKDIKLNHDFRRNLLQRFEDYYRLHVQDFGTMRSLPVLREILG